MIIKKNIPYFIIEQSPPRPFDVTTSDSLSTQKKKQKQTTNYNLNNTLQQHVFFYDGFFDGSTEQQDWSTFLCQVWKVWMLDRDMP